MPLKPGPNDTWTDGDVGAAAKVNYQFLQELFSGKTDPAGKTLRDRLLEHTDEKDLRAELGKHGIAILPEVRIMLVDIQKARTKTCGPAINPATDPFYVLVLPPKPTRSADAMYQERQTWSEASFHASNDGYGM